MESKVHREDCWPGAFVQELETTSRLRRESDTSSYPPCAIRLFRFLRESERRFCPSSSARRRTVLHVGRRRTQRRAFRCSNRVGWRVPRDGRNSSSTAADTKPF